MTWKSLADVESGLKKRPDVLAGPMLRKVTPQSVTVWVALKRKATVTLVILDAGFEMRGSAPTVAVGTNLHIVAVTATADSKLLEGKIYRYDLVFEIGNFSVNLATATNNASLTYPGFDKPSFCLPPKDITDLRIMHGSCRRPHGNGNDMLPMLDGLIEKDAKNAIKRPHQLLLTGDQIYADDVGYAMSMMLMDASSALFDWSEEIECNVPAQNTRRPVAEMYPRLRGHITQIDAGFTSVDFRGQLIGLGEYLAMYLFVWSDVLWPAALPTADEIKAFFGKNEKASDKERLALQAMQDVLSGRKYRVEAFEFDADDVDAETKRTQEFGRTIKANVRRALANIPTYMIFDDHEVTDDWNMTRRFCMNVYSSRLGLRIVQNALAAYTVCQHWGNAPEQFAGASTPGAKLLKLLEGAKSAAAYDAASEDLRALLGVHDDTALQKRKNFGLYHEPGALTYNYTIEGSGHQVIVTDTRSWRDYPRADPKKSDTLLDGGDLLPLAQLQAQITDVKPDTGNRMLLVVLSTNAPPTQTIRTASRTPNLTTTVSTKIVKDPFPDLHDSWEMSRNATDLLFREISNRLPLVNNVRKGSALLLSGDVHSSFTSRLLLRGSTRYRDPRNKPQAVNAVFVQMVCSSLRQQTGKTEGQHVEGYSYAPTGTAWMVPVRKPEGYLGWNLADGQKLIVGEKRIFENFDTGEAVEIVGPRSYSIWNMQFGFIEKVKHDWAYRLDYLRGVATDGILPGAPQPLPDGLANNTPAGRLRAAEAFDGTHPEYRKFIKANGSRREVVGVNNLGEVTFNPGHALHIVRWFDWSTRTDKVTTYVCSLDPDDPLAHLGKWPW